MSLLQLIEGDYTFSPYAKDELRTWGFIKNGFDYNIVSILGSQSGGKSTLLNMLFGTKFREMDEMAGRGQTTLGLWLSYDDTTRSLVMDVEGTDSKERGDEHMNFERKSALFSLALAEVLLVNMWCSDIGRYNASNYGTLKIVMELHLELFSQKNGETQQKTLLMFVLRDHTQKTSLEQFAETLTTDVEKIWADISKPEAYTDVPLSDLFSLDFVSLPHKELQEDKFISGVKDLKRRFTDKDAKDYVFDDALHKKIPADGLCAYAENIWDTIRGNKDLDIPTQKEILAMYRCDEILEEAYAKLEEALAPILRHNLDGTGPPQAPHVTWVAGDLVQELAKAGKQSRDLYVESAKRYVSHVYEQRRESLDEHINTKLQSYYFAYVESKLTQTLRDTVDAHVVEAADDLWICLSKDLSDTVAIAIGEIELYSGAVSLTEETAATWRGKLEESARKVIRVRIEDEHKFIQQRLKQTFERAFKFDENRIPRVWGADDDVSAVFAAAKRKADAMLTLFATMRLGDKEEEVLTRAKRSSITSQFEMDIDPLYREAVEAKRRIIESQALPNWVYLVICVLGFNEIMMVLSSPLLLFAAVLVGVGCYVLYMLNLTGPALKVVNEILIQAKGMIGEAAVAMANAPTPPNRSSINNERPRSSSSSNANPESKKDQ